MKTNSKKIISHVATETALSNSLVPQCLSPLVPLRKSAFTLAEVLITLAPELQCKSMGDRTGCIHKTS